MYVGITGVGAYLPEREVTTDELQDGVARSGGIRLPGGLFRRLTGIQRRRIAGPDEYASTLGVHAARAALHRAELDPLDIDLLLFASASRDMVEPATAHIVQTELGSRAHALDVTNACNSFVNGIDMARAMILAGRARRVLVVTGETPSRVMRGRVDSIDQARRSFAGFTFGDAGAAVVVEPVARGGILDVDTETQSQHWAVGGIPGGGSRHPRGDEHTYFAGDGHRLRGVFEKVGASILDRVRARTGLELTDYAKVLVHQVTLPYLDRFVEVTGVPRDRLEITVDGVGNVASATLGVQLDLVFDDLAPGERVLLMGLGGGVSIMTMVWERS
ncbi:3-oxoacyl-ACP synthase [Actinoplanes sp. SE50]|uniref:3-oxoacyl-ACP synthase III family protein n=1 Tax=unclassified Actinoplanes TaxID=2626549 RepID=UPI00023EBB3E|nr:MULTISPECIES: 3-oxoacyl-[acyl-carrier-protein] synthase III C-terminal domain-containing protein [unclassified Actinoplanes]AEV82884.1 putative 3-oxoacyl-(acyl-carrier-protein) synthase III [Actinoplanes sp. SE50/110]ATO81280.1 3-oxoacyl-ACP synthase [Actinoplanes sp. SE50]SLL98687.1 3-oxoacyl-ACP synthase [Actinoplanes sp. SE50/110]